MADNVPITAGSGTNIATDEVTGTLEHVQLVKLAYSADGVRTLVTADANGILVDLGTNNDVKLAESAGGPVVTDALTNTLFCMQMAGHDGSVARRVTVNSSGQMAVNLAANNAGLASETTLSSLNGKVTTCNTGAVVLSSGTITTVSTVTDVTTVGTLTSITNWGNVVDNAAFTDGTTRLSMSGFIFDETAGTALTENDAAAARIDSKRALIATIEDPTTRGRRATVTANNAVQVAGSVAHAATASDNPIQIAANARTTAPTAVGDNAVVRIQADVTGKVITQQFAVTDLMWQQTGSKTDTTDLVLKAAGAAGVRNYLTDLICANTSATDTTVIIKDGSTEIARFPVPAGGGVVHSFGVPLRTTAATALNAASSASVTTLYITGLGYQGR